MAQPRLTPDPAGYELQFATIDLGYFALTSGLHATGGVIPGEPASPPKKPTIAAITHPVTNPCGTGHRPDDVRYATTAE